MIQHPPERRVTAVLSGQTVFRLPLLDVVAAVAANVRNASRPADPEAAEQVPLRLLGRQRAEVRDAHRIPP